MKIFEKIENKNFIRKITKNIKHEIFIKKIQRMIKALLEINKKIKEDSIGEYAAEAAYFTILSCIPFLLFFISIMKFTNIERDILYVMLETFFPNDIYRFVFNIIEEIYLKPLKVFSLSSIIIIWSAGKGFFSLSKGLKNIYKIDIKNSFLLRIAGSIYTLILIFFIIIILILTIVGRNIYFFMMKNFSTISNFIFMIYKLKNLFIIFLLIFIFYMLYKMISNKDEKNFNNIYGAIFSAIIWRFSLFFISIYIEHSTRIFRYVWKFKFNNFDYDMDIYKYVYYIIWSRNKCFII